MIFIDGLGVGEDDPQRNPLAVYADLWPTRHRDPARPDLHHKPLDACLGVPGLPQSATGQTALLTGVNAPQILGKHLQGFPSRQLIEILHQHSIFSRLAQCGLRGTFANAYRHPEDVTPASRLSVTSHALKATGQPFRTLEQLRNGEALYHDFTNRHLIQSGYEAPIFAPEEAAEILVKLAQAHDFTLYEHFLSDVLAHNSKADEIAQHVELLSRFVRALLSRIENTALSFILTSDHGNIEDNRVRTHTRNPVPLIWTGKIAAASDSTPDNIAGVTPWVLKLLGCAADQ